MKLQLPLQLHIHPSPQMPHGMSPTAGPSLTPQACAFRGGDAESTGEGTQSPQGRDLEGRGECASLGSDIAGTGFGLGAPRPECQPTGLHRAQTGEGSAKARHCGAPSCPGRVYFFPPALLGHWVA